MTGEGGDTLFDVSMCWKRVLWQPRLKTPKTCRFFSAELFTQNLSRRCKNKSCNLYKLTRRHLLKFKYIRCEYAGIGQASGFDPQENRNAIFTFEFETIFWILNSSCSLKTSTNFWEKLSSLNIDKGTMCVHSIFSFCFKSCVSG